MTNVSGQNNIQFLHIKMAYQYHPKTLQCLSILQIIVGSISVLLGIVSAVLQYQFTSHIGIGIWVGVWIIVTGILGFLGSRNPQVPSKCLLGTFMGFAVTACVLAGTMLICCSIALSYLGDALRCYNRYTYYSVNRYNSPSYLSIYCSRVSVSGVKAGIGIDSVLLVISILEFAVSMVSSIYCCTAMCSCCNGTSRVQGTQQVVYLQPGMGQVSTASGGMVVMSGGPPGTVVQPPAGQFMIQQPAAGQPTFVPVSQPGVVPMQQYVASQTHPTSVPGGMATGGQTVQTQPNKGQEAPPAYT